MKGEKPALFVDTPGLLMHAIVHAADIQDRDGGVLLMATLFGLYPFLLKLYADGGYQGAGFQGALRNILKRVNVEIVKRSDQSSSGSLHPDRPRHGRLHITRYCGSVGCQIPKVVGSQPCLGKSCNRARLGGRR